MPMREITREGRPKGPAKDNTVALPLIIIIISYIYILFIVLFLMTKCHSSPAVQKLDGVGPVDNRPSTDQLHHFVDFFKIIYIFFSSSSNTKVELTDL